MAYFDPLLPWQQLAWQQLTEQYRNERLPHALLAGGVVGIGKRRFVARFAAWLLCDTKPMNKPCGECASCHWLKAGTHPDFHWLPDGDINAKNTNANNASANSSSANNSKANNANVSNANISNKNADNTIKIDDIRALQAFFYRTGDRRVVVLDHSETMTIAAANALLKTLEEPNAGVYLLLISDSVARLLPTIKSRVQQIPLTPIDPQLAFDYVEEQLLYQPTSKPTTTAQTTTKTRPANQANNQVNDNRPPPQNNYPVAMLLTLAQYAPLQAVQLPQTNWFHQRKLWLQTFVALQTHRRTPLQASEYWQTLMPLSSFLQLSQMMLLELWRLGLGLPLVHSDIDSLNIVAVDLSADKLRYLDGVLIDTAKALTQNIQEKMAYDRLFVCLASA